MKRLTYSISLSAIAVLMFVSVAMAQDGLDQGGGLDQYGSEQSSGLDQYGPNQNVNTMNNIQTSVSIEPFGFYRAHIHVEPGTTVQWFNADTRSHTVTADDWSFDSGELKPGQTFSFKFDEPGKWMYHSELDPDMTGSIIVGETSGGGGSTSDPTQTTGDTTPVADNSTQTAGDPTQMGSGS